MIKHFSIGLIKSKTNGIITAIKNKRELMARN